MRSGPRQALIVGLVLFGLGVFQWIEDLWVRDNAVAVTGHFTGAHEVRNLITPDLKSADRLHPVVEIVSPGGAPTTMVLADPMEDGAFASPGERTFLYLPGDPPQLRLPERVTPWGGPVIWWCLGLGVMIVFGAIWEARRPAATG